MIMRKTGIAQRVVAVACLLALWQGGCAANLLKSGENPLATISQLPGFCSIFHAWGFIGDSLSSGELESCDKDGNMGYHDFYEYSWGQRMCAAMGVKGENYSQGGETTYGWIENFWNNPRNNNNNISAKTSPKQAYIIALGANDRNVKFEVGSAKTDVDVKDYAKNKRTYAGCYAGIIQRVRTLEPRCKIFVVTQPGVPDDDPYNSVVRELAKTFEGVYVVDLQKWIAQKYGKKTDALKIYFTGGHLNAMGYQMSAWVMMTGIDWIIRHNMEDFTKAGFIGTSLDY